jgi:uncharacterized protein involved in cysteine biosynthesis
MIAGFGLAVGQLLDRAFLGVLVKALLVTAVIFGAVLGGLVWFVAAFDWSFTLPWIGTVALDGLAAGASLGLGLVAASFLMFPVAALAVGFFLDDIVAAVERRHYPGLAPVRAQPFGEALAEGLRFLLVMLAANLVVFVFYVLAGPFAPLVFWLVNGFLLGREYFGMVAARRLAPAEARALRRRNFLRVWLAGTLMAVPLAVPLLNLVIPVLGIATFTHLYHRLAGQPG